MTHDQLRQQIADVMDLPPEDLPDDGNLMDLGLDSMRAMNLAMQWEEAGLDLDFGDLGEAGTLAELWALIEARQAQGSA